MSPEDRYIKALREIREWRKDPLTSEDEEDARSWFRSLKPKWRQESMAASEETMKIILYMDMTRRS
jgi:hypothetical protein